MPTLYGRHVTVLTTDEAVADAVPGQRALGAVRWTILVYLASRVLLLFVAVAAGALEHHSLISELGRWDGTWYGQIASGGYPRHTSQYPTALGFFPLYPLTIWFVVHLPGPPNSVIIAGVLISLCGGLVAALLVQRLTTDWWGEAGARRATVMFCFFPGSIVFSMAYAEGLLLPLAAGCLLALQRRRWILAGALAGLATAVQPDAVALVVACAVAAGLELRRRGWRDPAARRSLLAPVLSVAGVGAFAAFLWVWTGTPFATLKAQRDGWGEKVDPLALVHQGRYLAHELGKVSLHHLNINVGPAAGLLGALVLVAGVVLLFKRPGRVSVEAMAFTLSVGLLAIVSENMSPNARLLITAFPAVLVFAYRCERRRYTWLIVATTILLVVTSALTYGGRSLTP
ncbi:MAG TPA: hypothetical protein VMD09_04415 [Solirubrobacteraceae bacterium]|nr:hypothetical protein [Solirubrobacteraceae bacterium]